MLSGANFFELVGPNRTIIGIFESAIICIIPLSIDIAFSSLVDKAVTRAGDDIFDLSSGNKAVEISDLILLIKSVLFFSIKKTGTFFLTTIFLARFTNFSIFQLFFL